MSGMRRLASRVTAAVVGALAAAALTACTASGATKAGAGGLPVTLTIGTADGLDSPYNRYVEEFARQVEERSGRSLRVEIDSHQYVHSGTERLIARKVLDGTIDLAHVPNRAFEVVGVDRLQALQAPYLIDTPEVADAVLASDITTAMLTDLREDGYEVLGGYTEGIRRPAGYLRPLTDAADFDGLHLRASHTKTSLALFDALGVHPEAGSSYTVGASGARISGAETAFLWHGLLPRGSIITANVGFFPKYNFFVMSTARYDGLGDAQRRILRDAARAASEHAAATRDTESELAEEFCKGGGEVVLADTAALESLDAAAAPLLADMRGDPRLASDLAEIEALAEKVRSEPFEMPDWCGPPSGDAARL